MPDRYCHYPSSPSSLVSESSMEGSGAGDNTSSSEDENQHRSYILAQTTLSCNTPVKQKSKRSQGRLLDKLLRLGKKSETNVEKQEKDLVSRCPPERELQPSKVEQSGQNYGSSASSRQGGTPRSKDPVEITLSGGRSVTESNKTRSLDKNVNCPQEGTQALQSMEYVSVQSNSFHGQSQKSSRSVLIGSRLKSSGVESVGKRKVKVILLGDPGVGKSTFLQTLVRGEYQPSSKMSNILSAQTSLVVTHSGQEVEIEIQDTAGQERFRSLTASYYRDAHGCLVFFNVNDKESFASVADWLDDVRMYHKGSTPPAVVLVGLLHRLPKERESFRRRSSLRGDDILNFLASSYGSSHRENSNISNGRVAADQEVSDLQHQNHRSLLSVPHVPVDPLIQSDPRAIPFEQAEHMAAYWEVPYREVDTRGGQESVLETVDTLLDLVLPDLVSITSSNLNAIVPRGNRNWSESGSEKSFTDYSSICCLSC